MPTERIGDLPPVPDWQYVNRPPCDSPAHNPPAHQVFKPGIYKHTCPKCGAVKIFTVPAIR